MSGARDMVKGQQASLIRERAGIPTARSNAQQIAILRAPKALGVVNKPIVTGRLSDGSAAAAMLAVGDRQGLWRNQSERGDDGVLSPRDDSAVPSNDFYTLQDGVAQVWSDAANSWVPGGPTDLVLPAALYQDASDTASTTATVTYQDAATLTFFLPPGVWTISADVSLQVIQTASSTNIRANIDGTTGTAQTMIVTTAIYTPVWAGQQLAGVSGGRNVSIKCQFKNNSAATVTAREPRISNVICQRTA